jgi:DNA polymerase-3 subunit delta'
MLSKGMARDLDDDLPESDRLGDFPHPRRVATLIGQGQAEASFLDAAKSGRLHHAWLLTGPKGIGKATLAYRIARYALNGASPAVEGLDMRAEHPVFRQIAALSHSDFLLIRRPYDEKTKKIKSVIPVDEVRRTMNLFGMSAGAGGWRVCIVDSADEMNANSANALLKILEEPPPRSLFILVSHQPGRLLPTIRSRCRTLALKSLDAPSISEILARNDVDASAAERIAIAQLAEGSAGRALAIAAGGGLDLYRDLAGLLKSLPRYDVSALHALADKAARRGADEAYDTLTELMSDWLQRLVRVGAGQLPSPDIVAGEGAAMARLAQQGGGLDRWVEVWEKINQSVARGEALNTDRKLVILNAFSMLETASSPA